ncbi:ketopantoate reductase family protein [Lutibacter sp.]
MVTGGVGCYFGARLVQARNNVTFFIARGEHLNTIKKKGCNIKTTKEIFWYIQQRLPPIFQKFKILI